MEPPQNPGGITTPTDDLARIHYRIAQRHLDHAKQRLAPRELEAPRPPTGLDAEVQLLDNVDPAG